MVQKSVVAHALQRFTTPRNPGLPGLRYKFWEGNAGSGLRRAGQLSMTLVGLKNMFGRLYTVGGTDWKLYDSSLGVEVCTVVNSHGLFQAAENDMEKAVYSHQKFPTCLFNYF